MINEIYLSCKANPSDVCRRKPAPRSLPAPLADLVAPELMALMDLALADSGLDPRVCALVSRLRVTRVWEAYYQLDTWRLQSSAALRRPLGPRREEPYALLCSHIARLGLVGDARLRDLLAGPGARLHS